MIYKLQLSSREPIYTSFQRVGHYVIEHKENFRFSCNLIEVEYFVRVWVIIS